MNSGKIHGNASVLVKALEKELDRYNVKYNVDRDSPVRTVICFSLGIGKDRRFETAMVGISVESECVRCEGQFYARVRSAARMAVSEYALRSRRCVYAPMKADFAPEDGAFSFSTEFPIEFAVRDSRLLVDLLVSQSFAAIQVHAPILAAMEKGDLSPASAFRKEYSLWLEYYNESGICDAGKVESDLYCKAINLICRKRNISADLICKTLKLDYPEANLLLGVLEQRGVIEKKIGFYPRQINWESLDIKHPKFRGRYVRAKRRVKG